MQCAGADVQVGLSAQHIACVRPSHGALCPHRARSRWVGSLVMPFVPPAAISSLLLLPWQTGGPQKHSCIECFGPFGPVGVSASAVQYPRKIDVDLCHSLGVTTF